MPRGCFYSKDEDASLLAIYNDNKKRNGLRSQGWHRNMGYAKVGVKQLWRSIFQS